MTLLGHEEAWRQWRAAQGGARMHHGWILAGKRGLGKAAFAKAAAAELVATPGVHQPPPAAHPDILVVQPLPKDDAEAAKAADGKPFVTTRNITVKQVREVQRRLTTRPTLGSRRAVIFDSADLLEEGAVNALLKSLEEPPQGTFFLLVAHRPGALLPTVRSRCRVLRFGELDEAAMRAVLRETAPDASPAEQEAAITVSGGSPGAALAFLEQNLAGAHALLVRIAGEGDLDFALRGRLAEALGGRPSRERLSAALEAARTVALGAVAKADAAKRARLIEAHATLTRLAAQAPTANFDAALLVTEVGSVLARAAAAEAA